MRNTMIKIMVCLALILSVTTSCEKGYYGENEDNKTVTPPDNKDDGNKKDDGTDKGDKDTGGGDESGDSGSDGGDTGNDNDETETQPTDNDKLTVNQFIKYNFTGQRWVTGYIVGACTKSIKNADFEPPFKYPQAILLADNPKEKYQGNVISIGLPSGSSARKQLNLVDNPKNYGKRISIFGERATYLGITGIKKPDGWEFE